VLLASATDFQRSNLPVIEDFTVLIGDIVNSKADQVRADMTYFETASGGAVFSTGSITWCGSLSWNHYDNNVSRITENVLRHFMR
ncbi:MAG: N,N-dimethylformamidase, partial [Anaerolineae bacterium]|nr:N,N-dimethylformamidase [Anaerolineae bacterium]